MDAALLKPLLPIPKPCEASICRSFLFALLYFIISISSLEEALKMFSLWKEYYEAAKIIPFKKLYP
jgi:hypothetical protein